MDDSWTTSPRPTRVVVTRNLADKSTEVAMDMVLYRDYDLLRDELRAANRQLAESDRTSQRLEDMALELQDERDAARRWATTWKRVARAGWRLARDEYGPSRRAVFLEADDAVKLDRAASEGDR